VLLEERKHNGQILFNSGFFGSRFYLR